MGERRGRRAAAVVAAAVLVGVLATGCGEGAAPTGGGEPDAAAPYTRVGEIDETLAPDGTTVRVGSPRAKTVVHLYEDPRCPVCAEFETGGGGEGLRELILSGEVRAEYTLASFLDDRLGGEGSKKAANALRAALDAGRFVEYHEVLFAHQPEEEADGYTDAFLLDMASKVQGLRGEEFDAAVKDMKHRDFVTASERAFDTSGVTGTPTMKVDGRTVGGSLAGGIFDKETLPMVIGAMSRS
ncbi:DsbA family protein [Streptomyces sp. NPDC001292]|uniref:DsbA family protein n=1 Tax=Streptomyces sp. NPDC001292 TaxID=3364558 RepID=UPI00369EA3D6